MWEGAQKGRGYTVNNLVILKVLGSHWSIKYFGIRIRRQNLHSVVIAGQMKRHVESRLTLRILIWLSEYFVLLIKRISSKWESGEEIIIIILEIMSWQFIWEIYLDMSFRSLFMYLWSSETALNWPSIWYLLTQM